MIKGSKKGVIGIIIGVVILIALIALNPFVIVDAGHTGVITNFGAVQDKVLTEGIHWKTPIVQQVKLIDNRIQKIEVETSSASKDMQTVTAKIAVNYRIDKNASAKLYKNVGIDFSSTLIAPSIPESIKAVTAKYTAEGLISERQTVSMTIKETLNTKLQPYGIVIDNLNIVNFDFSDSFNQAIEAKQTAQQLTLKAEQDLNRVKVEAQQKIEQAKAEAESLKAQKQEITPDLLKLREIEAKIKAINAWNGQMPLYVGGADAIFSIPLTSPSSPLPNPSNPLPKK